jgi:UPF0755 protein
MSWMGKVFLIFVTLVVCAVVGVGLFAFRFLETPTSIESEEVIFEVRPGESFKTVAHRLETQHLVSSASLLQLYGRFTGSSNHIRVGEYAIRQDAKPRDILTTLTSGKSIEYSITVQEGFNRFEIADLLGQDKLIPRKEFLDLTQDPAFIKELLGEQQPTLEGYLFPETYHVTKFTGAKGLIRMMVARFKENYSKIQMAPSVKMTRNELVTLASIIEKETGAPEERAVISSVFHNRLRIGMRLQTDPTVVYGIWDKNGTWNGNISRDDLLRPTRFNTYVISGLPPGPISNPGLESLRAAAAPAQSEFLFFVSRNDGTHVFSKDYGQHQKAVSQYQLDKRAREGKSWRDLQKRAAIPSQVIAAPPLKAAKKILATPTPAPIKKKSAH